MASFNGSTRINGGSHKFSGGGFYIGAQNAGNCVNNFGNMTGNNRGTMVMNYSTSE